MTDHELDAIADAHRWDTREGRRQMIRAALAAPAPTNQCAEACERATLCATCARDIAAPAPQPEPKSGDVYVHDFGSPSYLDGIEAQFSVRRKTGPDEFDNDPLAYCFERKDAERMAAAFQCSSVTHEPDVETVALITECRAAFAEELSARDLSPPLHHVKQGHDKCDAWLKAHGITATPEGKQP